MSLHFNGGEIELRHFSHAHTNGDTAVFFRGHNAVHLGDVFNNSGYPFVDVGSGGGIDGMIRFCEETLAQIDENTVVIPGHGPVTDTGRLGQYLVMLRTVRDRIQGRLTRGRPRRNQRGCSHGGLRRHLRARISVMGFVNRIYTDLTK